MHQDDWAQFRRALVAGGEIAVFARSEAPKDEGSIIVVFFPILEHPSNLELQCGKTTHKTQKPSN